MTSNDRSERELTSLGESQPSGKTILMADPNLAASRKLASAMRRQGHRVLSVRDGSKALELAVLRAPDLVLYDVDCPLLDARVFAQILGANPRTASVPVVLMGPDHVSSEGVRGHLRTTFLQKPFNIDEVMARVSQLLRRGETAEKVRKTGAIEGNLEQVSLPDILQMLSMNRRSGVLRISRRAEPDAGGDEAELLLSNGRVGDARIGEISGEKALFRVISWESGTFAFAPGEPGGAGRIGLGMDEVLLEGLRQKDELAALQDKAPARADVLAVAIDRENLPDGLHPVTAEVMDLLVYYRTCGEVVDHARATDLDVLRAIRTLIDRGFVRVLGRAVSDNGGRPLVGTDIAFALHGQVGAATGSSQARPRVVVAAPEPGQLGRMAASMSGVAGWRPDSGPRLLELGFGSL